jgi:hypothetical protein
MSNGPPNRLTSVQGRRSNRLVHQRYQTKLILKVWMLPFTVIICSFVNELNNIRTDGNFNALLMTTNDVQVQFDLDILEVPRQH